MTSSWIELSKSAIAHNVKTIRSLIGKDTMLAPCVKSNAYGHGMVEVARLLVQNNVDRLCVASIEEALTLGRRGIRIPILIIGFTPQKQLRDVLTTRSSIFVYEMATAKALSRLAQKQRRTFNIHIKVDTGMGRQGLQPSDLPSFIHFIQRTKGLRIEGIATHFATSDEPEKPRHFQSQLHTFLSLRKEILSSWKERSKPIFHCANSAATLLEPTAHLDMVRTGLAIYGYYPSETTREIVQKKGVPLRPSLTLKTRVAAVKELPRGACVSYGCTFTTRRPTKVAVLPIGYYDGIDRRLSSKGFVLIRGARAPILGRVCMNIIIVDVTRIPGVSQEDEAVIIGRQGRARIAVEEIATRIGTINYEVTTRVRESMPRVVVS